MNRAIDRGSKITLGVSVNVDKGQLAHRPRHPNASLLLYGVGHPRSCLARHLRVVSPHMFMATSRV